MTELNIEVLKKEHPILADIANQKEIVWINPDKTECAKAIAECELTMADVEDAKARLARFAPFIMKCFPETADRGGMIESPLRYS